MIEASFEAKASTQCNSSMAPLSGYHCNLSVTNPITDLLVANATACREACCTNAACTCYTWTPHEPTTSAQNPPVSAKKVISALENEYLFL